MMCKGEELDTRDMAATIELRELEFAVDALMALVRVRVALELLLENEPEGSLH